MRSLLVSRWEESGRKRERLAGGESSLTEPFSGSKFPANREKYREFFYFVSEVPAENSYNTLNLPEFSCPSSESGAPRNRELLCTNRELSDR